MKGTFKRRERQRQTAMQMKEKADVLLTFSKIKKIVRIVIETVKGAQS